MRSLNFGIKLVFTALFLVMFTLSCRYKKVALKSPPHYNFSEAFTDKLDLPLQKISGITWDSKNNVFLAVSNESGKLYFLDKETKVITKEYSLGDKRNYEDVALLNGIPYVLQNDGMIIRFNKDSSGKTNGSEAGKINLNGPNDFETMYSDPVQKALVIICKNCKSDDGKSISAYAYYPDSIGFVTKPLFMMDVNKVAELSPFKTSRFQPSAAAIHPVLKKLFIISAASKQLVVADLNGNVESVFKLVERIFPKPKGIAFKQSGDMYIANEGIGTKATLLKFLFDIKKDSGKIQSVNN